MEEIPSLIMRAQAGDLDAFGTLVQRFQDMAVGYTYSLLGDFHLAEDAAQEAFIGAYQALHQLRTPAAFPAWFRTILHKQCDRLTRNKRLETVPLEDVDDIPAETKDPAELVEEQEMRDFVLAATAALAEPQRIATTLFYINGYSQNEIAEFCEVPVTTIEKRLRDARKRLKERMIPMVQETLHRKAPSRNDSFINVVEMCNAAQAGDLERVEAIIKAKPELAHTDSERGYQAIHYAARAGHPHIVQVLLEAGASPYRVIAGEWVSALTMAKHNGHTAVVQVIERWLVETSGATPEGISLCEAVRQRDDDTVYQMLDGDPSLIHAVDTEGNMALHTAVQTRQLPLIIELLNRGAEVDRKNKSGKRPIHIALELEPKRGYDPPPDAKKQAIAGMLLARGAVYDVWTACALGDFDTVEALLNDDPEAAKTYDRPDYYPGADGYPLVVAAYYGHLEIVRLLLEHGADPDTPYDQYNGYHVAECGAPLLWACTNNDYEIAKLLLEHGANADTVKDASGNALDRAVQAQNDHMIKLLLRHGAIPGYDGKVNPGFYAMHGDDITTDATLLRMHPEVAGDMLGKALGGGHPDLVAMCLEYLPQIDDQHGLGLLGGASRMWRLRMPLNPGNAKPTDFYECFELLLKHGINPNARTPEGLTMLHLLGGPSWRTTHEADRIVFAGLLLDYGAEINIIGGELKSTPLGFAVRNGWFKLAEYLLGRGADPNLAGEPWATPLAWSEQGGHTEIAEILRKHGAKT